MKTYYYLALLLCCTRSLPATAQTIDGQQPKNSSSFAEKCNLLFEAGKYDSLRMLAGERIKQTPGYSYIEVISALALYYKGDTTACWKELNTIISESNSGVANLYDIQPGPFLIKHQFFGNMQHRYRYIQSICHHYESAEHITHPNEGKALLACIILDQYLRALIDSPLGISAWYTPAQTNDSMRAITDMAYDVYKNQQRIFSFEEIGSVYHKQFLLIAHETDTQRRSHYLSLLERAAAEGICGYEKVINFQLRTERNLLGSDNQRNTLDQRIQALKKKYGVTEYQYNPY